MGKSLITLLPYNFILLCRVIDVSAVVIIAMVREMMTSPVSVQSIAKDRPLWLRGARSPYLRNSRKTIAITFNSLR